MKIGLDFDGVISDCGKLKSDGAKKLYGFDIPSAKFKSRKLSMDRGYISGVENGKRNPTVATIEKLANALSVSVDELLK